MMMMMWATLSFFLRMCSVCVCNYWESGTLFVKYPNTLNRTPPQHNILNLMHSQVLKPWIKISPAANSGSDIASGINRILGMRPESETLQIREQLLSRNANHSITDNTENLITNNKYFVPLANARTKTHQTNDLSQLGSAACQAVEK